MKFLKNFLLSNEKLQMYGKFGSKIYESNLWAKFYELYGTSNSLLSYPKIATLVETPKAEQEYAAS